MDAEIEDRAEALRRTYGVIDGVWSDEQLDRILADHGFPTLDGLPAEPRGLMKELARERAELSAVDGRRWQRTNAGHLIGHVLLGHDPPRCGGCEDW